MSIDVHAFIFWRFSEFYCDIGQGVVDLSQRLNLLRKCFDSQCAGGDVYLVFHILPEVNHFVSELPGSFPVLLLAEQSDIKQQEDVYSLTRLLVPLTVPALSNKTA